VKSLRFGALIFLLLLAGVASLLWLRSLGMFAHDQYFDSYQVRIPYGWEIVSDSSSGFYAQDLLRLWKGSALAVMVLPANTDKTARRFPSPYLNDPYKVSPVSKIEIDGVPFQRIYWSQLIPTPEQIRQIYGGMVKNSWTPMAAGAEVTVAFEYRGTSNGKEIDFIGYSSNLSQFLSVDTTKTNWDELHKMEKIVLSFKHR